MAAAAAPDASVANKVSASEWIPLDETGFVKKRILVAGTGAQPTRKGTTVEVHYIGSLYPNGEVFDSSRDRNSPFQFKIGQGSVIKGWDVGVATMHVGEKAELLIASEYGYGKQGSPPKIPGDSTLLFEVELLSFDVSTAELSIAEKIETAVKSKEEGNSLFKQGKSSEAANLYSTALKAISMTWGASEEESETIKQLKLNLHSNLAAAYLKTKQANLAINQCRSALEIDANNAKAIYRLVQAHTDVSDFDEATKILESHRQTLTDNSVNVDVEMARVRKAQQTFLSKEKQIYSRMFS